MPGVTRRELFRWAGIAAAAAQLPACGDNTPGGGGVFTAAEREALDAFADVVIPKDDTPGGAELGAVAYISTLVTAFDGALDGSDVPPIFAGGPFSGRQPFADGTTPPNDFENFIELDRVARASWRLAVLGSAAVPGGAPNEALLGPVVPLGRQIKDGLAAAIAQATKPIGALTPAELATLFDAQPDAFRTLMIDLVTEATFAAPEYGGNPGLAGWDLIHFEGDSQPLGYSRWNGSGYDERPDHPMSTANPSDPEPMTAEIKQLLTTVIAVLGGRSAP